MSVSEPNHEQPEESQTFLSNILPRKASPPPAPPPGPSSSPLGLISLSITTFAFGLYHAGAGSPDSNPLNTPSEIFGLAVFYGGAAQFLAGVMEFRLTNTYASTVHCSYGAYWLAYSMLLLPSTGIDTYRADIKDIATAEGIFFLLWCLLSAVFLLAGLRTSLALLATLAIWSFSLFLLSVARFIAAHHTSAAQSVNKAGGVFAVFAAAAAFYVGAAALMGTTNTSVKLPVGDLSAKASSDRKSQKSTV
ncbi:hypothetical protein VHEMI07903 [[Torrubiella] hemipterigena]|uniref:Gpr1 family protein n=1 Tax=[Torrubiella] hemipterigena TaxID=1531966 RepID=A0A0A1TNS9_9HYPO|nr:hypothetical protein VHEMI07903 [[Torrubiella] hemipterigena]